LLEKKMTKVDDLVWQFKSRTETMAMLEEQLEAQAEERINIIVLFRKEHNLSYAEIGRLLDIPHQLARELFMCR